MTHRTKVWKIDKWSADCTSCEWSFCVDVGTPHLAWSEVFAVAHAHAKTYRGFSALVRRVTGTDLRKSDFILAGDN